LEDYEVYDNVNSHGVTTTREADGTHDGESRVNPTIAHGDGGKGKGKKGKGKGKDKGKGGVPKEKKEKTEDQLARAAS